VPLRSGWERHPISENTEIMQANYDNESMNNELNVKLPEYFTDNVRQYTEISKRQCQGEETDTQREIRLSKDAARAAARRMRETSPERRKRLALSAAHIAQKRKNESPEQRKIRLAKDAARTAERRRRETYSERESRLALDAARHAAKRSHNGEQSAAGLANYTHGDMNNNNPGIQSAYTTTGDQQPYSGTTGPRFTDQPGFEGAGAVHIESKYTNLLNVIEDLGREIKPTYAGSKMSQDRLKKGIMHARELVRGCLAEVEKKMR